MPIKNGLKTCLRERGRTFRFIVLLLLLGCVLILALGVVFYCNGAIENCNESYRTIALLEYMGVDYPDDYVADANARGAAAVLDEQTILSADGVLTWSPGTVEAGYTEGYRRKSTLSPYAQLSVVTVGSFSELRHWETRDGGQTPYYSAAIMNVLFSKEVRNPVFINIVIGDTGFVPEPGTSYVLHGYIADGEVEQPQNGLKVLTLVPFEDSDEPPYAALGEDAPIPERFFAAVEQHKRNAFYLAVYKLGDVRDAEPFHQNELVLDAGDYPDPLMPGGCVVSADLAQQLSLAPGDPLPIETLRSDPEEYYRFAATGETNELTVTGIASASYDYVGCVWTTGSAGDAPLFGYTLGTASIGNDKAEEAAIALRELVPENVRVTVYDQGYADAVKPFQEVRKAAAELLIACVIAVFAVLFMFAFLYVGKQSYSVKTMVQLGTPRWKVTAWMLSGAFFVSALSAGLAVFVGVFLQPLLIEKLVQLMDLLRIGDSFYLFSETEVGYAKHAVAPAANVPLWLNLTAAGCIVAVAIVLCRIFLIFAYRSGTRRRGKSRVRVPRGRTSSFGFGPGRFARLSIRRGGMRTLVVPLVSCVLTVTVVFLSGIYQSWVNELDALQKNTQIDGMVVSMNGKFYANLAIPIGNMRELEKNKLVEEIALSKGFHYYLDDEMPTFSDSGYGKEYRQDWIETQPKVVTLNDLRAAREFYYRDAVVTWLDGWDESMLVADGQPLLLKQSIYPEGEETCYPAVLGSDFMERRGMKLGDTVRCEVQIDFDWMKYTVPLRFQAVGEYRQEGGEDSIFIPLSATLPLDMLTEDGAAQYFDEVESSIRSKIATYLNFETCRFRLRQAADLEALRESLHEAGFSTVGHANRIRTALLLNDAFYMKLAEPMKRNILFGKILGVTISMLLIAIGFLISWLMTNARKWEFGLMRGLGASSRRTFRSFFYEQLLLCLFGCALGLASLYWLYAGGWLQLAVAGGFFVFYLIGCALAIRSNGKLNLMELPPVRD